MNPIELKTLKQIKLKFKDKEIYRQQHIDFNNN